MKKIKEKLEDLWFDFKWDSGYEWLKHNYKATKCWFRDCATNKYHWKLVKEAFCGYPWDYCYLDNLYILKMKEMIKYFEQSNITTNETYQKMLRWMKLCIKIYNLLYVDDRYWGYKNIQKLFKVNDDGEFLPVEKLQYFCDKYVNIRNRHRFTNEKQWEMFMKDYPHELYNIKLEHLFYKIINEHKKEWWD